MTPSFALLFVLALFGLCIGAALGFPLLGVIFGFACWIAAVIALGTSE